MLRPLPYRNPNELVAVHARLAEAPLARLKPSPLDYSELSQHHDLFAGIGAMEFWDLNRTGIARPEKVNAVAVTRGLLDVLGEKPILGRLFEPEETPSVVISERYWDSDFGRDPAILTRSLTLDGKVYPVIGVMPSSFAFPNEVTQMWVPLTFRPAQLLDGKNYYLHTYARLRPGLNFDQASKEIEQLSREFARTAASDLPRARPGRTLFLAPMGADDDGTKRQWIAILFAATLSLWAIVCWNFASLLMVRWTDQKLELAVRKSLGATTGSLVWQVLRETLVLCVIAGIAGLVLTRAGVALMSQYGSAGTLGIDAQVYWFCAGLCLLTAVVAGVYPARGATGELSLESLKEAAHQSTAAKGTRRWQQALIVAQVAAATVMLVAGGLFARSLISLLRVPTGFDAHNVTSIEISLPRQNYQTPEQRRDFWEQSFARIRALPGVTGVSGCTLLPFGYGENINTFSIKGRPQLRVEPFADINEVLPGYFTTMRIPLLSGRYLDRRDSDAAKPVVLIDETLARRFFASENPVGRQIRVKWGVFEVAGVVGSVKNSALDLESAPELYFPAAPRTGFTLVIRTEREMPELSRLVAQIVSGVDPDQPIYDVISMDEFITHSLKVRRFVAWLVGLFAVVGCGLASLGLFNLLSYTVQTRQREIGIRMAVGASSTRIASWICRSGFALVMLGLVAGAAISFAGQNVLRSQLFGIGFLDAPVWTGVLGGIGLMGVVACLLPAWRAARINPSDCLRG